MKRRKRLPRTVVLSDLDSTIADTAHRHHLAPTRDPSKTWADYAGACLSDVPMLATIWLLRDLSKRHQIHIISGRDGSSLEATKEWLALHEVPYDVLVLREPGDESSNADIKVNYVLKLKRAGLDTEILFDDWPETVAAVQQLGVRVMNVGNTWHRIPEPDGSSYV